MSAAPSEQFTPTTSGCACSTETQNASAVCPERLRPLLSTAVNESQSGSSGAASKAAEIAAFALSESKIVSIRRKSTPPSRSARIWCAYASRTASNVTARYAGSSTRGESESVTFSGPTAPATNGGCSGLFAAHLALDEHAPGSVEHGDPLAEHCFESLSRSRHPSLPPNGSGSAEGARAGSLGVW